MPSADWCPADSSVSPRQETEMAFATCDRCWNAIVLGDHQAHQAFCPYCKEPLRIATREEFFARLNREDSKPQKERVNDSGGQRHTGG
jgi:hypothetical protein